MMPPQEFRPEAGHGINGSIDENKPIKGKRDSPTKERGGGGD
jgi:hypothetical protein